MAVPPFLLKFRKLQVRGYSRLLWKLQPWPLGRAVCRALCAVPGLERAMVGYKRGFATKAEAEACLRKYDSAGHVHQDAIRQHISFGDGVRASDAKAIFHIERLLPGVRSVVDIGGSAGNVFYSYSKQIAFSDDFVWTVVDLDETIAIGRVLAEERGENRLRFARSVADCRPAELVLISGALHFLDASPPELLATWPTMPAHILINRSPVLTAGSVYGIQDQGSFMTVAKVLHRGELLQAMDAAGYALEDEWSAPELRMTFPLRPDTSVTAYSGFLFSLRRKV